MVVVAVEFSLFTRVNYVIDSTVFFCPSFDLFTDLSQLVAHNMLSIWSAHVLCMYVSFFSLFYFCLVLSLLHAFNLPCVLCQCAGVRACIHMCIRGSLFHTISFYPSPGVVRVIFSCSIYITFITFFIQCRSFHIVVILLFVCLFVC